MLLFRRNTQAPYWRCSHLHAACTKKRERKDKTHTAHMHISKKVVVVDLIKLLPCARTLIIRVPPLVAMIIRCTRRLVGTAVYTHQRPPLAGVSLPTSLADFTCRLHLLTLLAAPSLAHEKISKWAHTRENFLCISNIIQVHLDVHLHLGKMVTSSAQNVDLHAALLTIALWAKWRKILDGPPLHHQRNTFPFACKPQRTQRRQCERRS